MEKSYVLCNGVRINFFEMFMRKNYRQTDKLGFGGESPLTMRAQCRAFRYCPNPLGIVPAQVLDKLEFIK